MFPGLLQYRLADRLEYGLFSGNRGKDKEDGLFLGKGQAEELLSLIGADLPGFYKGATVAASMTGVDRSVLITVAINS